MLPGGENDFRDVPLAVHHRVCGSDSQQKPAPMLLKNFLVHACRIIVCLKGHHPRSHLGDGDFRTPVAQGGSRVQAHQTGPHNEHPLALAESLVDL